MLRAFTRSWSLTKVPAIRPCCANFSTMPGTPINKEVDSDDCLESYQYVFNPELLKDKVAFITGGGSGIGFRITELLMRHGCNTAIASRKIEKVQTAADKLKKATGRDCVALQMDVRKPDEVEKTVDSILSHYNKIDILINSAAGNFLSLAETLSPNAFKTVMEIDTQGTFNTNKAVFDKYFKKHGGNIISISATLDYKGLRMQTHAGSAKAAIDAMTRHLAVEWGQYGIRVNNIAPGPIGGTEGMRKLGGGFAAAVKLAKANIPLGRWGQKTEIGEAVIYLSSSASSYVTGTVLVVDGGDWMTSSNSVAEIQKLMKSKM